jgi:outer membrane protein assembly factor BamB
VTIIDLFNSSPDEIIIAMNKRNNNYADPYCLNIVTGELKILFKNPGNVQSWKVDNSGVIRIANSSDGMLYRKDE